MVFCRNPSCAPACHAKRRTLTGKEMDVDRGQWAAEHLLHGAQLLCREHDRRTILLYEDEFELTFNLSGEEPQPEQAAQEPPDRQSQRRQHPWWTNPPG